MAGARTERITADQADAVRTWAHIVGWHSLALIPQASPAEASLRQRYLNMLARADGWRVRENLVVNRDALQKQLDDVRKAKTTITRDKEVPMGISSSVGHEFSMVVKEVLEAWEFHTVEAVRWDPASDDIEVNGWNRQTTGRVLKRFSTPPLRWPS